MSINVGMATADYRSLVVWDYVDARTIRRHRLGAGLGGLHFPAIYFRVERLDPSDRFVLGHY